ncbi:TetR/AcrR family transcriptional regulator [Thermomonas sp. HDW16]|uniref:TetR/AcrR family transcriptional regulator n=1 Tax=Thermomonas sp. HDW16 TaxID=2714945 RepID=UPI001409DD22|nr:TetR/AcrR family transcriptional regulator [Thermomonas sp. HDW16]QIL19836.1 TetR/AcrR family transcriptional regulator [Thermomonas sp. HDW16]
MISSAKSKATESTTTKSAGPGRPKDPGKRAAILDAAKRMFVQDGFDGVSMDQIASEAGVSKLTVYSHFGDKDSLFAEAVRAHCEQAMPSSLFVAEPEKPVRERLTDIGHAFFGMIMTPEAIAGHRVLCTPQATARGMPSLFWEAGPKRVQDAFTEMLERRIEAGELEIDDPRRAASQFFTLLKGEAHAQAVFGYSCSGRTDTPEEHVASVVDLFLRAYAVRP